MSQYASAISTASGCRARTRPMTYGQNSSAGAGPACSPQVLANTSLVSSIAMSQRTPSHWSSDAAEHVGGGLPQPGVGTR